MINLSRQPIYSLNGVEVYDRSETRYEAVAGRYRYILWVDNEDSNGQWFIRLWDEELKQVFFDGWWADSVGKSVDEAIAFAQAQLNKRLSF